MVANELVRFVSITQMNDNTVMSQTAVKIIL